MYRQPSPRPQNNTLKLAGENPESWPVVNGPTKSRVLARFHVFCPNVKLHWTLLYVKRYWDNVVPIKACLLGRHIVASTLGYRDEKMVVKCCLEINTIKSQCMIFNYR